MLSLRHKEEYFIKYWNIVLEIQQTVSSMENVSERYLEMGVLVTSVWTWQLQDPLHREERETHFTLNMD